MAKVVRQLKFKIMEKIKTRTVFDKLKPSKKSKIYFSGKTNTKKKLNPKQEVEKWGEYFEGFSEEQKLKMYQTAKMIFEKMKSENKRGLYLVGGVGVGKTTLLKVFKEMAGKNKMFITKFEVKTSDLFLKLAELRNSPVSHNQLIKSYQQADYLFLDDLGVEKESQHREEIISSILDYRCSTNLPTIITSNLTLDELGEKYDKRIISRINGLCLVQKISGNDKRK